MEVKQILKRFKDCLAIMIDRQRLASALQKIALSSEIRAAVLAWLEYDLDAELAEELEALIEGGDAEGLADRFGAALAFGTGGMRGPMGVGPNRMNHVTIAGATQGLADYLRECLPPGAVPAAVVCMDSRINSDRFARQTAATLAANGMRVHLFRALRPTPELSFAVRQLGAAAGVMITASHNPKEDNGYKAYWSDGAQIVEPHDERIVERVRTIRPENVRTMDFDAAVDQGAIQWVGEEMDEAFLAAALRQRLDAALLQSDPRRLKIVFTGLHGTGGTIGPEALRRWGFADVAEVPSQARPDGLFPTVKSPNPENGEALDEAIRLARQVGADLVLATDPDADRVGIAVRDGSGGYRLMSGNDVAVLLAHYIASKRKALGLSLENAAVVKSIVTTDLIDRVCQAYGIEVDCTLTGFKWIAGKIRQYETEGAPGRPSKNFLYGCEESYGYMAGTHARDKDAITAACLIAEAAAWAKANGQTLLDTLDGIMAEHGIFAESQISIYREGLEGQTEIARIMDALRADPPASLLDEPVATVEDIETGAIVERATGKRLGATGLPRSNVLIFKGENGGAVVARPSGTEPKIKFYFTSSDCENLPIADRAELERRKAALRRRHERLRQEFKTRIDAILAI
ncbi:MAG: Phosphoglucomutase [candidate division BRC1 bacterium ADurb.BinA364]|nr:MAG: Phosphoglucomutase [candidate division BRC1 bacterium ADurb.BinA364]